MKRVILILAILDLLAAAWFGLNYFTLKGELNQIGGSIFYRCEEGEEYVRVAIKNAVYCSAVFFLNFIILLIIYRKIKDHPVGS